MAETVINPQNLCLKLENDHNGMTDKVADLRATEMQGRNFNTVRYVNEMVRQNNFNKNQIAAPFSKTRPGDTNCTERLTTIRYIEPVCCEENTGDCDTIDMGCTTGTSDPITKMSEQICVEDCVADEFTLQLSDYDCDCIDLNQSYAIGLRRVVQRMVGRYNTKLGAKLFSLAGQTFDGTTPTATTPEPLPIFFENPTTGKVEPQPIGWEKWKYVFQRMTGDAGVSPLVLHGSRKINSYSMLSQIYSGNEFGADGTRMDMSQGGYYDPQLATIGAQLGIDEAVFGAAPGAFDLLEWYQFDPLREDALTVGADGRVTWLPVDYSTGENYIRQKIDIGTPTIGIPFVVDMAVHWSACDNVITWKFRKFFDVWCPPAGATCGDYNWKVLFNAVCAPYGCDDMCSDPHPCLDGLV